ncbi:MAG: PD-(D/E)XK nuclease family protein [Bacteroidales bacterium]|nr:PD-(D/E)XK nuclease family protein [Bacteroidales bacterium]
MREIPFIDDLADKIHRHAAKHERMTVVLPSQRVVRALSMRLSRVRSGEVFWLPRFRTMDEFVYDTAALRPADPLWLSLQLYAHYERQMRAAGETPRAYADFMEWGALLLSDFHQLDAQLAPVAEVLHYVADEKRIAGMDFSLNEQSAIQAAYLRFFTQLQPIYERFTAQLSAEGVAYPGLAERRAVEVLGRRMAEAAGSSGAAEDDFTLFAGFNAITEAEAEIMRLLVKAGRAEVYWDADRYYVEDPLQEAGLFLRRYAKDPYIGRHISREEMTDGIHGKKIVAQGVPQWTGQAEMAARYISEWYLEEGFTGRTAVVLNEEALLLPLLNALPEAEGLSYNLSIGVPLDGTHTHVWVEALCAGREEAERSAEVGVAGIRMETLAALLRATARLSFADGGAAEDESGATARRPDEATVERRLTELYKRNQGVFTQAEWADLGEHFGYAAAPIWAQIGGFCFDADTDVRTYGLKLSALLQSVSFAEASDCEREYRHLALAHLEREQGVRAVCERVRMPFHVWRRQTVSALAGLSLHYKGDAEARVQISGMLETRMLDFDRVIMLSMNEGILPSGQYEASFLMDALKRHCHIPTLKERNAMQAYYFYRLLARPSRVVCLYEQSEKQEKSRFLWQLAYEKPDMAAEAAPYPFPTMRDAGVGRIEVPKDALALAAVKRHLQNGVSPSAISTYLNCSLRFYYKYVLELADRNEFDDSLDAARKGTVVHRVLEDFFKLRLGRRLTVEDSAEFSKTYPARLEKAVTEELKGLSYKTGENGLEYKKMERWLHYFAKAFAREIRCKDSAWGGVAACETRMRVPFKDTGYQLTGTADRVDVWREGERVVDYKTGVVDAKDLRIREVADLSDPMHGKALQLLLYAYMYWVMNGRRPGTFPEACNYPLASLDGGYMTLNGDWVENKAEAEKIAELEDWLDGVLTEMTDGDRPFTQNLTACRYCAYADMCGL